MHQSRLSPPPIPPPPPLPPSSHSALGNKLDTMAWLTPGERAFSESWNHSCVCRLVNQVLQGYRRHIGHGWIVVEWAGPKGYYHRIGRSSVLCDRHSCLPSQSGSAGTSGHIAEHFCVQGSGRSPARRLHSVEYDYILYHTLRASCEILNWWCVLARGGLFVLEHTWLI